MKSVTGNTYAIYRKERIEAGLTFAKEVKFQRRKMYDEAFWIPRLSWLEDTEAARRMFAYAAPGVIQRQQKVRVAAAQFQWDAGELDNALMSTQEIDIRARLMAADACFYPQHSPSHSFQTDLEIAAAYLPFMDVYTTDAHMAELLRQSGVSADYEAIVLSSRRADRESLMEYVQGL